MAAPSPDNLTIEGVAELLQCTTRTVRQFIANGQLPAYRIGKRMIRVKSADVEALLRPIPTAGPCDAA